MNALEIGQKMVELVNQGRDGETEFVNAYYADNIVSIEGGGSDEMPARIEGIEAIRGKHEWWFTNNEVHGTAAEGPYVGNRDDQFVVRFVLDSTPAGGARGQMTEVGLFTTKNNKIIQEEYLYLAG
ncbi:MAG: nuclear transport factor 2 family protein [Proteobacteria bacterium]|nr:nuclear transport factor 2 family protein [Pseudomonadota bacterium]